MDNICDTSRVTKVEKIAGNCLREEEGRHILAFWLIAAAQIFAGIATAPFNTVAYVYIDDNLEDKTCAPFYLGMSLNVTIMNLNCSSTFLYTVSYDFKRYTYHVIYRTIK